MLFLGALKKFGKCVEDIFFLDELKMLELQKEIKELIYCG